MGMRIKTFYLSDGITAGIDSNETLDNADP